MARKVRKKKLARNPYVVLLRRRGKAVEPSPKAYRRRAKHRKRLADKSEEV